MEQDRSSPGADLHATFGEIDIYLFDQLLRGRFDRRRSVLDAGCGGGRNLPYFLRHGFDVRAIDADASAIRSVRELASSLNPALPLEQIQQGSLTALPWPDASTDAVICSAVLHFARDDQVPYLDVAATIDPQNGQVALLMLNRDLQSERELVLDWRDPTPTRVIACETLTGPDLKAFNTFEDPKKVVPQPLAPPAPGARMTFKLPARSYTVAQIATK